MFLRNNIIDLRDEKARADPSIILLDGFFSLASSQYVILKFLNKWVIGFKTFISNVKPNIFVYFAFSQKRLHITQQTHKSSKIWLFHMKERRKSYQNRYKLL